MSSSSLANLNNPDGRRKQIMNYLIRNGATSIEVLAEKLDVSKMTIYRDISILEAQSLLIRRRGEVIPAESSLSEAASSIRMRTNTNVKTRLGHAAFKYLRRGHAVILDDSSSSLSILDNLPAISPLTVVTNAEFIAHRVRTMENVRLLLAGGEYVDWADSYFGEITERAIASLHVDVCIMSATAIANGHCYHPEERVAHLKRAMMRSAHKKILLVDSSKFARSALYEVCSVTDFDILITDSETPTSILEPWRDMGLEIEII